MRSTTPRAVKPIITKDITRAARLVCARVRVCTRISVYLCACVCTCVRVENETSVCRVDKYYCFTAGQDLGVTSARTARVLHVAVVINRKVSSRLHRGLHESCTLSDRRHHHHHHRHPYYRVTSVRTGVHGEKV